MKNATSRLRTLAESKSFFLVEAKHLVLELDETGKSVGQDRRNYSNEAI